jgi:hypothetical protein
MSFLLQEVGKEKTLRQIQGDNPAEKTMMEEKLKANPRR